MDKKKLEVLADFAKYTELKFKRIKHLYPKDVQKAHDIMIKVIEVMADPKVSDQKIRSTTYEKIPKEKVIWAYKILKNIKTNDEIMAEERQKHREKRRTNKGMDDELKLSKKKIQELYENFETMGILNAVDNLDYVRSTLGDREDKNSVRPPELRDQLLELHEKAHNIINCGYNTGTDEGMFSLAWEIEDELFDLIDKLEHIKKAVTDLTDLTPSEYEEDEDCDDEEEENEEDKDSFTPT